MLKLVFAIWSLNGQLWGIVNFISLEGGKRGRGKEEGEREGRGGEGGKRGRGRDSGEGREEREREG